MSDIATDRLTDIHSMLSAGHRSLRLERHSLMLWGLAGGLLFLISDQILTSGQFPVHEQRAMAWLVFLACVLGAVGAIDWYLTRRAKRQRDQAWPFVHRQIIKVWWLLIALGILLTFAMFFFGGGYMVFAAWIVLAGIGLYVHGLFSQELLEWTGLMMIAIGVATLAFGLHYQTAKLIAASVYGIGLPLLAVMLARGATASAWQRLLQATLWTLCVLVAPLIVDRYALAVTRPEAPVIALEHYLHQASVDRRQIVTIPAGTQVPVKLAVSGNLFQTEKSSIFPLTLAEPIEVMIADGKLTGDFRPVGGNWSPARDALQIRIPSIAALLTPEEGPVVRAHLTIEAKRRDGN